LSHTVEKKLHAVKCVSAVEQYQGMCVRYLSDLDGIVDRKARKPWITQEVIVKWMNWRNERGSTVKKKGRTAEC
jgi:hypothetical protein